MQALGAYLGTKQFGNNDVVTTDIRGHSIAKATQGTNCQERQKPLDVSPRSAKEVTYCVLCKDAALNRLDTCTSGLRASVTCLT